MLKIILHNFKGYKDATFEFKENLFHFIHGISILWCLYGKLREVCNDESFR